MQRPITVVASGSAPFDLISSGSGVPARDVFYDAKVDNLEAKYTKLNSYYASADFQAAIGNPKDEASFTADLKSKVKAQVDAAHNVGWYRFVEYSRMDADGQPRGELTPYGEVIFPFDPALQHTAELAALVVTRREGGPRIRETYRVDDEGIVSATITDLSTGHYIEIVLAGAAITPSTTPPEAR